MRVGFDLDGVLFDFGKSVREYMDSIGLQYGWKDDADEPHTWNFFEYWGMSPTEFVTLCHDGVDAGYIFRNNVRDGAVDSVKAVKDMGHDIIVITDRSFGTRPEHSEIATHEWWEWAGFPEFDEIHFSPNKVIVPTDIFVEDKLQNYDAITLAGTECWLINRPWNTEHGQDYRRRIDHVGEYVEKVALKSRLTFLIN